MLLWYNTCVTGSGFFDPQEVFRQLNIQSGMKVADFGSGSGVIAVMLAQAVGEEGTLTAIDVLPSAVELVQSKAKQAGLKNVIAIRANLEKKEGSTLKAHSQDIVFLGSILWQSEKKQELIFEAERVLKKDGRVLIIEWKKGNGVFCPPEKLCVDEHELENILTSVGLKTQKKFPAGAFHYGIIAGH